MDLFLLTCVVVATLSTPTPVESSALKNLMHLELRTENNCLSPDTDLFGNDLNFCGDKTETPEKCQELCGKTSGCVQFTWLSSTFDGGKREKECCLKNVMNSNFQAAVGAISGPKQCGSLDTAEETNATETVTVRLHFNETCCEAKGVPADCMGLCREKVESRSLLDRTIQMVMPVDICEEHKAAISTCMIEEVHCEWNDWQLGECSATCGGGSRINTRTKKVEEANGGICEGEAEMEDVCNTEACPPIHCEWDEWAQGDCSASCGTGTKTNTRTKLVVEANGGTCTGQDTEILPCNPNPCPIDCEWDEWQIGECSKTCGGGMRTDIRHPKDEGAQHGGEECAGPATLEESCNVDECPVDCVWDEWEIGSCSLTCGGGIEIHTRVHLQPALFNGTECEGPATAQLDCNTDPCPVPCVWNDWQSGECSVSCGDGMQTKVREKEVQEEHGGTCECEGVCDEFADTVTEECNLGVCPPIHCAWGDWVYGQCSKECGTGTRTNTREKTVVEEHGGTCDGQPSEIDECNTDPCPVDCVWDEWVVGDCSKSCGGGLLTKTRTPLVDAAHGGVNCTGDPVVSESCNVQECPVDCVWGDWVIGQCSQTCDHGTQTDTREEFVPAQFGGLACDGEPTRVSDCFIKDCPIVFHFNETCCTNNGIPESCMGLCREKLPNRQIEVIMPVDQCAQHSDTVRSCLYSEGGESISDHLPQTRQETRSFDGNSLGMPIAQMLVVGTIDN